MCFEQINFDGITSIGKESLSGIVSGLVSGLVLYFLITKTNNDKLAKGLKKDILHSLQAFYELVDDHHNRYIEEEKFWQQNKPNNGINPSSALQEPSLNLSLESLNNNISCLHEVDSSEFSVSAREAVNKLLAVYNSFVHAVKNKRSRNYYFQKENGQILAEENQQRLDTVLHALKKLT